MWEVNSVTNIEENLFAIIAAKSGEKMEKHTAFNIQTCSYFFMLIINKVFGYEDHFAPI